MGPSALEAEAVRGGNGTKGTYSITERGLHELRAWVATPSPIERIRNVELLRCTHLDFASYEDARRFFAAHLDHFEQSERRWSRHALQIEQLETPLIRARLSSPHTGDKEAAVAYKVHVYRGFAAQARLEVDWAREGLALVDRLEKGAHVAPDAAIAASD